MQIKDKVFIVTGGASSSSWQGLGGPWDTLNIRG